MSSHVFHRIPGGRVRKTTAEERLKLENLKIFDPIGQEQHRLLPATMFTKSGTLIIGKMKLRMLRPLTVTLAVGD
jgi:hypothetical protein